MRYRILTTLLLAIIFWIILSHDSDEECKNKTDKNGAVIFCG